MSLAPIENPVGYVQTWALCFTPVYRRPVTVAIYQSMPGRIQTVVYDARG